MTTVASFAIEHLQILDPDGTPVAPLPPFAQNADDAIAIYRAMVLARAFDGKAIALQRTGRLGTFASSLGQEAVAVGTALAMHSSDVFIPSFREHGGQLVRGVTPDELFLYWGGDERGSQFKIPTQDFPNAVPVGTHAPHATGVALAMKLRNEPRVAVCMFGDGATSKGDVYEALNMAGVWRVPLIVVISNNQWAISVPRSAQSAAETLAQKAIGVGIEGLQVDGNDVFAVRHAVEQARRRAVDGGGPTLIEALTYRLSDHTTADDARRYRDDEQVSPHWKEDPIARLRAYLVAREWWRKTDEEDLQTQCKDEIEAASLAYLGTPPQSATSMFDCLYAQLPTDLAEQRAQAAQREIAVNNAKESRHD